MPEAAHGKPLEIWFQDEARVGQQGTLTRIWADRGTRPRAPRDTRYESAYIFGAVCPARAETAALVMPRADTHAMNAHLAEISKSGRNLQGHSARRPRYSRARRSRLAWCQGAQNP